MYCSAPCFTPSEGTQCTGNSSDRHIGSNPIAPTTLGLLFWHSRFGIEATTWAMPESAGPIAQQAETLVRTAWLTATANIQWFTKISPDGSCLVPDFTHCTDEMM